MIRMAIKKYIRHTVLLIILTGLLSFALSCGGGGGGGGISPDTTPPTVTATTPANGATDVAVNTSISVVFSEVMSSSTINTITFTLKDGANNPVSGTVGYSGTTATFTPSAALVSSTLYTAKITAGVKDLAGNAMLTDYSWTFTTGIAPDTTPPTITATAPVNGATDVAVTSLISATFSEAMSQATINENSFTLRRVSDGAFFAGTVSSSEVSATFTPVGLPYDELLYATITTAVKDLSGNALVSNFTWSFRTVLPPLGALDPSFGADGKVTTHLGNPSGVSYYPGDYIRDLIIQSDGKIVAAGTAYNGPSNITDFALARYNTDGTLDSVFGNSGATMTDFGGQEEVRAAAIQANGKIVVVGESCVGGSCVSKLACYDSNGTLDTTFGTNGAVTTDVFLVGLVIQSDGKMVVSGSTNTSSALVRFSANGTLDTTFGTGGIVLTAFPGNKIAIQTDGKLILSGAGAGMARFNADGTLDTTFGTGGISSDCGGVPVIQSDGKIVVGFTVPSSGRYGFALSRCNADGTLDTSFGTNGTVTTDFGGLSSAYLYAVSVRLDGKIVAAGTITYTSSRPSDFAIARYNTNGTLDTNFGTLGLATTDFNNSTDSANALRIQSDGKIVAAGGSNKDFAVVRYLAQ